MSVLPTQLFGGNFQDAEGNLLSGGYLTLLLSNDESVGESQICAGVEITVPLDAFGNVVSSPGVFVYATDVMIPINAYYRVTGYTAEGQTAWGPNCQQIPSGGVGAGTFDLGSWTPNTVISWFPSPQPVTLEVNGAPSSSQTKQNLVEGANVTLTDLGSGNIEITSSGGSSISAGTNVVSIPWVYSYALSSAPLNAMETYSTAVCIFPAQLIQANPSKWKVTINVYDSGVGDINFDDFAIVRTLPGSLTVIDFTPITFGGNHSFSLPPGYNTSDAISLPIDPLHDYYFMLHSVYKQTSVTTQLICLNMASAPAFAAGVMGGGIVDEIGTSPIQNPVVPSGLTEGVWIVSWQAA
jgi:hypothetical protein